MTRIGYRRNRAFSLVEVLVVVAFMGLLMGVVGPGLLAGVRGTEVTRAGNRLADMVALARQTAADKNVVTALVLGPEPAADEGWSATVLEFGPDREWRQAGGWESFPSTVDLDASPAQVLPPETGAANLRHRGRPHEPTRAVIFYPGGRMLPGASARIVVIPERGGESYEIVFNLGSSSHRIVRD